MGTTLEQVPKSQVPHPQDGDPQFIELLKLPPKYLVLFCLFSFFFFILNLSERDPAEQKATLTKACGP